MRHAQCRQYSTNEAWLVIRANEIYAASSMRQYNEAMLLYYMKRASISRTAGLQGRLWASIAIAITKFIDAILPRAARHILLAQHHGASKWRGRLWYRTCISDCWPISIFRSHIQSEALSSVRRLPQPIILKGYFGRHRQTNAITVSHISNQRDLNFATLVVLLSISTANLLAKDVIFLYYADFLTHNDNQFVLKAASISMLCWHYILSIDASGGR